MVAERRHVLLPPSTVATPDQADAVAQQSEARPASPSDRGAPAPAASTGPVSTGSRLLLGLSMIARPVLLAAGALAGVLLVAAIMSTGGGSDKTPETTPATTTSPPAAAATTTRAPTTTAPAALITGERAVLGGPPRGGIKYGTVQVAKAGTELVAPEVSTGSLKATTWQWVLCVHDTKNCEPVEGATKARWTVTALAAGNDVRVRVGLGTSGVDALSAPVFIQIG